MRRRQDNGKHRTPLYWEDIGWATGCFLGIFIVLVGYGMASGLADSSILFAMTGSAVWTLIWTHYVRRILRGD